VKCSGANTCSMGVSPCPAVITAIDVWKCYCTAGAWACYLANADQGSTEPDGGGCELPDGYP
jgi:hypothetical protein